MLTLTSLFVYQSVLKFDKISFILQIEWPTLTYQKFRIKFIHLVLQNFGQSSSKSLTLLKIRIWKYFSKYKTCCFYQTLTNCFLYQMAFKFYKQMLILKLLLLTLTMNKNQFHATYGFFIKPSQSY